MIHSFRIVIVDRVVERISECRQEVDDEMDLDLDDENLLGMKIIDLKEMFYEGTQLVLK